MSSDSRGWPELSYVRLAPTVRTLHLWSQIVGKVRLVRTPWINHGWQVTLMVTARGLGTPLIPAGPIAFSIEFDFVDHMLVLRATDGGERRIALRSGTVAGFYASAMEALASLGAPTLIDPHPNEIADAVAFPDDREPRAYDPDEAARFWRALVQVERIFTRFRSGFLGKSSPVHFFWGSFDLAVTRFSGRRAPLHPGGVPNLPDAVTREAYSHEESSAGFWPGDATTPEPSFYSYAYPAPAGFAEATAEPTAAYFDLKLGEFLLPYEAVRSAPDPDEALLAFLRTTYRAAADLGAWDRDALECAEGTPCVPRPVP
jgi:hypothetical protein